MIVILFLIGTAGIIESTVLDPALYLSPSPPFTTTHSNDPEKLWSTTVESGKNEKEKWMIISSTEENAEKTTTKISETMEEAETFWPSYRSSSLRGIRVPLTYHLSGTYGGASETGVLTSGYMGLDDSYGILGKAVLAGSGYKSYGRPGIRLYGGDVKPAWGGWGNGKWGHYGKG